MSSAPEPPTFKKEPPKEKDFQSPGLRGVRTTTLFRAVNPELFIKPNVSYSLKHQHFEVSFMEVGTEMGVKMSVNKAQPHGQHPLQASSRMALVVLAPGPGA
ncbi:small integral membrane protein 8 isoform X4 [Symphalangus syndactylus]|nr:small integral membrane protein 8 isoform X2 [Symphalangus syndactylus]